MIHKYVYISISLVLLGFFTRILSREQTDAQTISNKKIKRFSHFSHRRFE